MCASHLPFYKQIVAHAGVQVIAQDGDTGNSDHAECLLNDNHALPVLKFVSCAPFPPYVSTGCGARTMCISSYQYRNSGMHDARQSGLQFKSTFDLTLPRPRLENLVKIDCRVQNSYTFMTKMPPLCLQKWHDKLVKSKRNVRA